MMHGLPNLKTTHLLLVKYYLKHSLTTCVSP